MSSYPVDKGWPKGWNDEEEAEYQRKEEHRLLKDCPICTQTLAYGHIIPFKGGYAHRKCILIHKKV